MSATASASSTPRSVGASLMCRQAARRRARTESPASSMWGCRSISSAPQIKNEPTSMNSAAGAPGGGDHDAAEHRSCHERGGEGDVQRRVRLALGLLGVLLAALLWSRFVAGLRFGLIARGLCHLRAQQRAGGQGGRPVKRCKQQHCRQPEMPQQDREPGGHDRLEHVQRAQLTAAGGCLNPGDDRGNEERG